MNFWRQTNHIMSYFKEESFRGAKRLPSDFMTGFLEVSYSTILRSDCARFADDGFRGATKPGLSRRLDSTIVHT